MTNKYAVDIIAPTKIIDRHTGDIVVIDNIEPIDETDRLLFDGYFEESGTDWTRVLDWDSVVKVVA